MALNITTDYLTKNKWSRPSTKLGKVKGIVIHYTASPMGQAASVRNFFERRKNGKNGFGSAHFIVGLKGEIIQCLPYEEMAYHVGSEDPYTKDALARLSTYPNNCTIGIEMCHEDATGKPNLETLHATIELAAFLLKKYGLTEKDLWTHKEVVGWKICHKYYVEHPDEWANFKNYVKQEIEGTINNNTQGGKVKVADITNAQKQIGVNAVNALNKAGLIDSPDYWINRIGDPVQNWLFFEMIRRINDKIK